MAIALLGWGATENGQPFGEVCTIKSSAGVFVTVSLFGSANVDGAIAILLFERFSSTAIEIPDMKMAISAPPF